MHVRPRVAFSRCFGIAACRYDGDIEQHALVEALQGAVEVVDVCPELRMGLGVPRPPIRVVRGRLVQPSTGRDLTAAMEAVVDAFARDELPRLDGLVLKSRSPSCGRGDTARFETAEAAKAARRGDGLFAGAVYGRAPDLAWIDEVGLREPRRRLLFLARLWTIAAAHRLASPPSGSWCHWQRTLLARLGEAHRETLRHAAERAPLPTVASALRALADGDGLDLPPHERGPDDPGLADPWPAALSA